MATSVHNSILDRFVLLPVPENLLHCASSASIQKPLVQTSAFSCLFPSSKDSIVWMYHTTFIHLFSEGHSLPGWANVTRNDIEAMFRSFCVQIKFLLLLGSLYLEMGLRNCVVMCVLKVQGLISMICWST